MSDLPEGWAEAPLGEILEINPRLDKSQFDGAQPVHFVPMAAVEAETGKIDISEERKFADVSKSYTAFRAADVIFAKITPCMENGKIAVVPPLRHGLAFGSTEFHVLRCPNGVDPHFLFYRLVSQEFRRDAEHNMTGAVGQRRVPTTYLSGASFPLPPLNEQRRIVAKIEALFSRLEEGGAALRGAKARLKLYRQSLLKAAFEGRLTETWRRQNPHLIEPPETLLARIRTERETAYKQALADWQEGVKRWQAEGGKGKKPRKPGKPREFPTDFRDLQITLPPLPHGWAWGRLGLCTIGVEYGTSAKSSESGRVPVLRMGNLQAGKIDWGDLVYTSDETEIARYRLRRGDVLFNRTNSPELVGKTAIVEAEREAIFAGYLVRVNQIDSIVSGKYLNYFLNSDLASRHGNTVKTDGVNQSNINGNKLQEYPFPFCSPAEQAEIVRILEERLSRADALEAEIDAALARAEALRQAILKRAFSGRLVPQDPTDEPATTLLTRLRAQRDAAPKTKRTRRKAKA